MSIKKIILIIILIVLAGVFFLSFYNNNNEVEESDNIEAIEIIDFEKTGVIVINNPGLVPNNWYLIYEEPGRAGLNAMLEFDDNSKCLGYSVCNPEEFDVGTSVLIKGVQKDNFVLVKEFIIR